MLLGVKMGLDARVLREVVGACTGSCWSVGWNNPVKGAGGFRGEGEEGMGPPCEREYEGGFATALMLKVCFPFPSFSFLFPFFCTIFCHVYCSRITFLTFLWILTRFQLTLYT